MKRPSRRSFLRTSVLAGTALTSGAAASCKQAAPADQADERASGKLDLTIAGYPFDRVQAIIDGRVQIEGCQTRFERASIHDLNAVAMGGDQRWEVQEIGLHPYMLAYSNDGFRDYTLVPVFPLRTFRHKSIFVHTDSGIRAPEDLRGRRVATAGYSQSSLTWIRGILQHEYGVHARDMEWVISVNTSEGGSSKNEVRLPKGIPITLGPEGKDESELLMDRQVDAVLSAKEPRAFIDGDPKVARLFVDSRRTEREYYKKTGIFPIMHALAIRQDMAEQHPWLPGAVFTAYCEARDLMYSTMRDVGWAMNALPWYATELEETRELMGERFWPYGIERSRKALEAFFLYSYEQGLCERELRIDELFHPSTLELPEPG
jgi:4,5-dihydroxyphthalate decarboxylase